MPDTTEQPDQESAAVDNDQAAEQPDDDRHQAEAAKYRRRLRSTETERDRLAQRVEQLQRAEVARIAGAVLEVGEDLFTFGTQLADVLDPEGNIDSAAVQAAAEKVTASRPGLAKPRRRIDLGQGGSRVKPAGKQSWSEVISGR